MATGRASVDFVPDGGRGRRRTLLADVGIMALLALAATLLFAQVLDTGFWSPEDFAELEKVATSHRSGELDEALHPVLAGGYASNPVFVLEFRAFGLDPRPYYVVNLLVHVLNSILAYLLVNALLHDRRSAFAAALLFALSVGSYGKNLMFASGVSSLIYALAVLLGTLLYVVNEKRYQGRFLSWAALAFFVVFVGTLFMRGGTFSLLASISLYNVFFRRERGRPVMHHNLVVCWALAAGAVIARASLLGGTAVSGGVHPGAFLANLPGYLVLMVFPIHRSELLASAPRVVQWVYDLAPVIRVLAGLTIFSYSLFGFIFGNRAIRFYIAWMYVMVVPFAMFRYPADWLNLRFLYLVSLGFCVLLVTGTFYAYGLLSHRGVRRFLPFAIPGGYVLLTALLVGQLDHKNEALARSPESRARLRQIQTLTAAAASPGPPTRWGQGWRAGPTAAEGPREADSPAYPGASQEG